MSWTERTKMILSYILVQNENGIDVKKEDVYRQIQGSRQTQIKTLNELMECGYISSPRTGAHNTKYLEITDAGKLYLYSLNSVHVKDISSLNVKLKDVAESRGIIERNEWAIAKNGLSFSGRSTSPPNIRLNVIKSRIDTALSLLKEDNPDLELLASTLESAQKETEKASDS